MHGISGTRLRAECGLALMGYDMYATIEFRVTSWGCAQTRDEPAWGPEWEVSALHLAVDYPGALGPPFEATGALFDVLAERPRVQDAVVDAIYDYEREDYYA